MNILDVQTKLAALGFSPGALDDQMGPQTIDAIKRFQEARGLVADGIAGPKTLAALDAPVPAPAKPKPEPNVKPVKKAASDPPWLVEARAMLGIQEAPGKGENPAVLKMFADAGHPEVKHDAVPWCAAFVGAALKRGGIKGTGSLWALDYKNWGVKVGPILGAVAIKTRSGGGHVTFVAGLSSDRSRVFCLGGNQSDMVNIASYPTSLFEFRWPKGVDIPTPPAPLPTSIAGARAGGSEA